MSFSILDIANNMVWSAINGKLPLFAQGKYVAYVAKAPDKTYKVFYLPQYAAWGSGGNRILYYSSFSNKVNYIVASPEGTISTATSQTSSAPVAATTVAVAAPQPGLPAVVDQPENVKLTFKVGNIEVPILWAAGVAGLGAILLMTRRD